MTIKKLTVIAAAGAVLLAGAIGISMRLTSPQEMELEVPETTAGTDENGVQTLSNMENIPLYYDETEKLLLPLRNVMEGLGGTVTWNKETKMTEVTYRDRTLALTAGEEQAILNGYEVTLPAAAEIINGCLYADEALISAYYTGEVDFNIETRQVVLQAKDNSVPVMAMNTLTGKKDGRVYEIELPVIVGLNDSRYEASLNNQIMQEMQVYADTFLQAESAEEGDGQLKLVVRTGMYTKDILSIWWEGTKDGVPVKFAKNIDLLGQKVVTLADMLAEDSLMEVKAAAGEGWTEDRFYLTEDGALVLLKGSNESSLEMHHWTQEGKPLNWQKNYKELMSQ